jgi:hypothetical protein
MEIGPAQRPLGADRAAAAYHHKML